LGISLSAPTLLSEQHETAAFACGQDHLDDWLKRRALPNQRTGASRCYVIADGQTVIAYYALASGALASRSATGKIRRNMPDPIPMAILGRLAIDSAFQVKGLGRALFRDAALRVLSAAGSIGIRGLLVHAISDEAVTFYKALGLDSLPSEPRTLMVTLADLQAALDGHSLLKP
jgi:GNAT superfamily N-acetyltransferase